jgi:hypothetical protein
MGMSLHMRRSGRAWPPGRFDVLQVRAGSAADYRGLQLLPYRRGQGTAEERKFTAIASRHAQPDRDSFAIQRSL